MKKKLLSVFVISVALANIFSSCNFSAKDAASQLVGNSEDSTKNELVKISVDQIHKDWKEEFMIEDGEDYSINSYLIRDLNFDGKDELVAKGENGRFLVYGFTADAGFACINANYDGNEDVGYTEDGFDCFMHDNHEGPEKHTVSYGYANMDENGKMIEGTCDIVYDIENDTETGEYYKGNETLTEEEFWKVFPTLDKIHWISDIKDGWIEFPTEGIISEVVF